MKTITTVLSMLFAVSLSQSVLAADAAKEIVITDSVSATATIVDVNKKDRKIVLRNAQGNEMSVIAGPEVRNFDQIKKGDLLDVEYRRAAASSLEKASNATAAHSATGIEVAPKGEKPGAVAVLSETILAEVMDLDKKNRLVTLKGPRGGVVTVQAPIEMKTFDELKKGDMVSAQYSEAVAVSVRAPAKK
jgi:hypothetical protein